MEEGLNEEEHSGRLSRFNSAGIVNATLNNLWVDFFRHMRYGEFLNANNDLDCIWTILGGEKNVKGKQDETDYTKIQKNLHNVSPIFNSIPSSGFKSNPIFLSILKKQKEVLMEKSLFLRRLQNRQGKGTAYDEEGEDELE